MTIIQAIELPVMDLGGVSDPYVKVGDIMKMLECFKQFSGFPAAIGKGKEEV